VSDLVRRSSRRTASVVSLLAVVVAGLIVATAASAAPPASPPNGSVVTVMSRNLYLGADLSPAIGAGDICSAIDAGGTILNDVDASNFPERAKLLADEIAGAKPDLVGLQEVALWRYQDQSDYAATPATTVRYDFLENLLDELSARGAGYSVAVVQDEFDQELPADRDHSDATNDFICGADEDGRLTMRDAILVRDGSGLDVSNPQQGHFDELYGVLLGGIVPIDVTRGWVSVDVATKKSSFHFVNTHLEAFGDPAIREAQARELFAPGGPLQVPGQVVLIGDINSGGPLDRVGTGFTTPGDEGAYEALTDDFGMTNLGARQTCCYPDVFESVIGDYRFDHTVDHVMTKPAVNQIRAYVTGADPSVTGAGGVVASDHGGVVSKLKLSK
jgi:endonuclease/exonuclease/phosphatase family metal-dependent hydrolase